jgi:hypothetical protein
MECFRGLGLTGLKRLLRKTTCNKSVKIAEIKNSSNIHNKFILQQYVACAY